MNRLSAVDLFSGAGGTTLGLRRARFRVLAGIECDPLASESYRLNHPNVRAVEQDIRDVAPKRLMRDLGLRRGDLDLLVGCPPCQSYSRLPNRNSRAPRTDSAADLVLEVSRFAKVLMPRVVLVENVPGLKGDWRFEQLASELDALGYRGTTAILDAADFGVPQRRQRLLYLASRAEPCSLALTTNARSTVRDAIASLPRAGFSGDRLHDLPESRSERVRRIIAHIPKDGGSRADLPDKWQLECHRKTRGFFDVYGRMAWDQVAPTITGGCVNPSKGRFLHPEENRCITLREAACLQGFPKRYRFSLRRGKFPAAQLIGNAFPPGFVAAHARSIRRQLS